MFPLSSKTTTFLAYLTLLLAATALVDAHDSPLQQRDHAQLKRIIKKRAPQGDLFPTIIGAAPIPSSESESLEASSSTSASSESVSPSSSGSLSASASVSGESSASSASSTSEALSASASETPTSRPTEPQSTVTPPPATERSTSTRSASTRTLTTSIEAEASAPPSMAGAAADDRNKSSIVTILIAVAASIGGVFILWTIFRKWKLGSSKKFDKRLQPIDWEKPGMDDDIIPANRRHSGSSHSSGLPSARTNTGFNNVPDHDFTAGPAHLSPVGGYADMSRGPSPSPQFGAGVPLHHQSGYNGGRY